MTAAILKRLRRMDAAELKFRATAAIRSRVDRARTAIAPPAWRRESLTLGELPALAPARTLVAARDWRGAHLALANHFVTRRPRFLIDPQRLPQLAEEITRRFPGNRAGAAADRVLTGRYDLLGYRNVAAGSPPDWHHDPVHGRRTPQVFWDAVPYLDPAYGDHKIIWEINRHQHFLTLGRAFALTNDRRYYREFVGQLEHWLRHNPPLQGTNWASMLELAFRSLSWIWSLHLFAAAASPDDDQPWIVDLLVGLDRQLEHVDQNLSRYFSPNTHLSGEALALYVAGRSVPELASAARYEAVGRAVLLEEAHRQVHDDGGHAELSTHYHRYSTDFYLLAAAVARVTGDPARTALEEAAHRQARFLRALADDTGRLPNIGDDDGGQLFPMAEHNSAHAGATLATAAVLLDDPALATGPPAEETLWMCGSMCEVPATFEPKAQRSAAFPRTGYVVCRDDEGLHLVFDCGPHGFLNGGHAHADALSVVASVGGAALLTDTGTATYTMDPEQRHRFRSTAMHNTVVVGGRSQAEPRGPFHWHTRVHAHRRAWCPGGIVDYVEGFHDAYAPVRHVRGVFAIHGIGWVIVDHLLGEGAPVEASAMWHVHPQWAWGRATDRGIAFRSDGGREASLAMSVPLRVVRAGELDAFSPEYGRVSKGLCLAGDTAGTLPQSVATFVSAVAAWKSDRVTVVDLQASGRDVRAVFRIDTPGGTLVVMSSTADEHEVWGTGPFRTAARATLLRLTPSGPVELCSVHGSEVASSMQQAGRR
jgi:hypothetical protein